MSAGAAFAVAQGNAVIRPRNTLISTSTEAGPAGEGPRCRDCQIPLTNQRAHAKACPECRVIQVLGYMVRKRTAVRKCRQCHARTRSAGQYDLCYCVNCIAERLAGPAPSKTFRDIARGTVTRCDFCEYDATAAPADDPILAKLLKQNGLIGGLDQAIAEHRAAKPPVDASRPAMDARVPLCLRCAKHPDDQAKVLAWLEARQAARKASAS